MKLKSTFALACLLLAGASQSNAQLGGLIGRKPSAEKEAAKEAEREKKNAETYEKIKADAEERYSNEPRFKRAVDEQFDELLREHKAIAYDRNIHRGSKVYAVHEDRFRIHESLYDNLLVQHHINRIGQALVPKDSDKVFAFRLLPDPTPNAETLATGTIYISTGMLSILDNEAQVAYVLAHEMAHVNLDHWRLKVKVQQGVEAFNADQAKKAERAAALGALGGVALGGIFGRSGGAAALGALAGGAAGLVAGELMNRRAVLSWDAAQEDEADRMAFKYLMESQYDVREVPKLYIALENAAARDTRTTLGFLGERNRVKQRRETSEKMLVDQAFKADIELRLKNGGFKGDSAEHRNLMAELKRDNGIMAFYNDMFTVARRNLEEAVAIRENDPTAQYYLGKVLETIGRTPEDRKLAETSFARAVQYDFQRENFGAHLHYALMMMGDSGANTQQIAGQLDTYVTDYAKYQIDFQRSLLLPPNLTTIYEYMKLYGQNDWQPKLPAEFSSIVANANVLPTAPDRPVKGPVTPTPVKQVTCPPGMPQAACTALKNAAGAGAAGTIVRTAAGK